MTLLFVKNPSFSPLNFKVFALINVILLLSRNFKQKSTDPKIVGNFFFNEALINASIVDALV